LNLCMGKNVENWNLDWLKTWIQTTIAKSIINVLCCVRKALN